MLCNPLPNRQTLTNKKQTMSKKKGDEVAVCAEGSFPVLANPAVPELVTGTIDAMGLTPFQLTQLRVPSGEGIAFTIPTPDGAIAKQEFLGVIGMVKAKQRAWYHVPFADTGGGGPPDCHSADGVSGYGCNDADRFVEGKVAPGSTVNACASCEWNQYNSKRGPGGGKDCEEVMHLYVWLEEEGMPAMFKVPPTSLKAVQLYGVQLSSRFKTPAQVLTRFALVPRAGKGVPDSSTLQLSCERDLDEDELRNMGNVAAAMRDMTPALYPVVTPGGTV